MEDEMSFSKSQAGRYGLNEAILLRAVADRLQRGQADDSCYTKSGTLWVRLTIAQLQGDLFFLTPYSLRTSLDNLVSEKLIMTDEDGYRFGLRKRKWVGYALTERGQELMGGLS